MDPNKDFSILQSSMLNNYTQDEIDYNEYQMNNTKPKIPMSYYFSEGGNQVGGYGKRNIYNDSAMNMNMGMGIGSMNPNMNSNMNSNTNSIPNYNKMEFAHGFMQDSNLDENPYNFMGGRSEEMFNNPKNIPMVRNKEIYH
jgi:hypothetical protein